jgi:hypothetical protein
LFFGIGAILLKSSGGKQAGRERFVNCKTTRDVCRMGWRPMSHTPSEISIGEIT